MIRRLGSRGHATVNPSLRPAGRAISDPPHPAVTELLVGSRMRTGPHHIRGTSRSGQLDGPREKTRT